MSSTPPEPLSDEPGGPARWRQIADRILARIASGDLEPGQPVPSTTDLAEAHGVAPMTARQALTWLAQQGHVTVHQGRRSVVAERKTAATDWTDAADWDAAQRASVQPPERTLAHPPVAAPSPSHLYRPQSRNPLKCEECGGRKADHR